MTNEEIKEKLTRLEKTGTDFDVILTGKESRKVNGLYKPETHEILIHNKNFQNDDQIMYTAIHEYVHHIVSVRKTKVGLSLNARCHDTEFWAKMDDLVEKAVELGIFKRRRDEKLSALIKKARELDGQIVALQCELGDILRKIQKESKETGARFEDIAAHDLKMREATVRKCCKLEKEISDGLGQDEAEAVTKARTFESAKDLYNKLQSGKTVSQTKHETTAKSKGIEQNLRKEKMRIQKTISAQETRLETIEAILSEIAEDAA